jgi:hypothetical protein
MTGWAKAGVAIAADEITAAAKNLNLVIFLSCIRPAPAVRAVREQECDLRPGIPERRSRFSDGDFLRAGALAPLAKKSQMSLPDLIRQSIFLRSAMVTPTPRLRRVFDISPPKL